MARGGEWPAGWGQQEQLGLERKQHKKEKYCWQAGLAADATR